VRRHPFPAGSHSQSSALDCPVAWRCACYIPRSPGRSHSTPQGRWRNRAGGLRRNRLARGTQQARQMIASSVHSLPASSLETSRATPGRRIVDHRLRNGEEGWPTISLALAGFARCRILQNDIFGLNAPCQRQRRDQKPIAHDILSPNLIHHIGSVERWRGSGGIASLTRCGAWKPLQRCAKLRHRPRGGRIKRRRRDHPLDSRLNSARALAIHCVPLCHADRSLYRRVAQRRDQVDILERVGTEHAPENQIPSQMGSDRMDHVCGADCS
jgi:hypothetical protein